MINSALKALRHVIDLIYPERCACCGKEGETLCNDCKGKINFVDPLLSCSLCGRFLGESNICGECIERERNYERGYFLFYYEGPVREAIHSLKFHGKRSLAYKLLNLGKDRIEALKGSFDFLIPIPITKRRLKERGFNQSYLISLGISKLTGIPVLPNSLVKVRETEDQFALDHERRKSNVRNAFGIRKAKELKGKRILIVDDLFTTGYTVMEASRTLKRASPSSICVFALARATT